MVFTIFLDLGVNCSLLTNKGTLDTHFWPSIFIIIFSRLLEPTITEALHPKPFMRQVCSLLWFLLKQKFFKRLVTILDHDYGIDGLLEPWTRSCLHPNSFGSLAKAIWHSRGHCFERGWQIGWWELRSWKFLHYFLNTQLNGTILILSFFALFSKTS